jgi:hypothetical protein
MKKLVLAISAVVAMSNSEVHSADTMTEIKDEINTQGLGIAKEITQNLAYIISGDKVITLTRENGVSTNPLNNTEKKGAFFVDKRVPGEEYEDENITQAIENFHSHLSSSWDASIRA